MGTGAPDTLDVPYLPNSADIVVGDLLTSSGLGGRFPRDYPVARVTSVTKDSTRPYATVAAEPVALLERSREVLLVWPANIDDQEKTTPIEPLPTETPSIESSAPQSENAVPVQPPESQEGLF
jgi:rod shape-determining protein MreC